MKESSKKKKQTWLTNYLDLVYLDCSPSLFVSGARNGGPSWVDKPAQIHPLVLNNFSLFRRLIGICQRTGKICLALHNSASERFCQTSRTWGKTEVG